MTQGGRFGGYGFYLPKGRPVFLYNLLDLRRVYWEGPDVLSPGKHASSTSNMMALALARLRSTT